MYLGKFKLICYIGSGNFGKVFRVQDTFLDVERALKIISVNNAQEFIDAINEAQVLERCRHNHIVDIKEIYVHEIGGKLFPCIVTEYLKNGSVQGTLEREFVSVQKSIKIITQVLFGLEHAHNQGVFHRDLKPGNILYSDNGQAKLSDFGFAYGLAHQEFNFAGYSSHLPPEVLEGVTQDAISDLYSMGVTLHRLLNNIAALKIPFADNLEWIKALKKDHFPERTYQQHIPDQVIKVVKKSMKADRDKRFQNCLQFRQALQKIPFAIEWMPIDKDNWEGEFNGDIFKLNFSQKRSGFCVDFKRNGRKLNNKCYLNISNEDTAREEFFKIIRETTIKF
jgi:serine/threonine protein kinase